jgi:putative NADH-flavin reductase
MRILVLGASGRLGRHIVDGLLDRGHSVRAFIHNENVLASHGALEVFQGDVHDPAAISEAVRGVGAVVSALGSAAAPIKDIASSAIKNLMPAMAASGVRRIVSATGSAAWREQERASPHPYLLARRERLMQVIPELVIDGEKHMSLLEDSGLDWIVVRAPQMQGDPSRNYVLSPEPPSPYTISSYLAVATAMVDQLVLDEWVGAAPFVW